MPGKAKEKRKTVYWDTCVILAWIKDEQRSAGQMEGLRGVATEIHENRMNMITSEAATSEIDEGSLSEEAKEKLEGVFSRSNTDRVNIDNRIGKKTSEILQYYRDLSRRDGRPRLCYADAQHLAAAIVYNVDEFHTFDRDDKNDCRGLLGLSGDVAGHSLVVCMPRTEQIGLL